MATARKPLPLRVEEFLTAYARCGTVRQAMREAG
jgi:hypothetical protein